LAWAPPLLRARGPNRAASPWHEIRNVFLCFGQSGPKRHECEAVMLERVTQVRGPRSWVCVRIEQIKSLILEMGRERRKLSCDLEAEETRVGISDPNHYAYSPLARTLRERRDRVEHSIDTLKKKLESMRRDWPNSLTNKSPSQPMAETAMRSAGCRSERPSAMLRLQRHTLPAA
jgi:hypothetical protein